MMKKFLRLGGAAALTLVLCSAIFSEDSRRMWYIATECVPQTTPWYACFSTGDLEFETRFYGMKYFGNTQNLVDNVILKLGAYERPALYFFRDLIGDAQLSQGVFLDLGANVGEYSLFMSRYVKEVHAFEPYPPVLARLRRHVEANAIKNIIVHPVGVGNKSSSVEFFAPPKDNLGSGSFIRGLDEENTTVGVKFPIVRLDDELASLKNIVLVKMDIEGYERFALEGLAGILAKNRPTVFMEISSSHENPDAI